MDKDKLLNFTERLLGFSFYLLAAGLTFSNSFTEIGTFSAIALWLIIKIAKRDYHLPGGRLNYLLIIYVTWNLLSFLNTSYIDESVRGFFKSLKHALLFLAAVDYFNLNTRAKRFLLFSIAVGFFISLNGIIQYIYGMDIIRHRAMNPLDGLRRISSSFVQYNDFGAYLVIITAIICSLFFSRSRLLKERILIMVIAMPVMWCLFATKSRGAWIGTVIAVLSMASLKSKRLLAAILVLLCVSPVFLPASVKSRFSDFSEAAKGGTTWERMKLWSGTIAMVKEHPILGFGVNTYTRNFPKYKPADYPDVRYTHNSYLQMGAEIGIVGAGIFLIFLVSTIISSARGIGMFKKGLPQDLYVGLYAGVIGFLFHCGVDTHLYSVTLSAFIFLYLGLMLALRRQAGYEDKA